MKELLTMLTRLQKAGKILIAGAGNLISAGTYTVEIDTAKLEEIDLVIEEANGKEITNNPFIFHSAGQKANKDFSKPFIRIPCLLTDKAKPDAKVVKHGITATSEILEAFRNMPKKAEIEVEVTVEDRPWNGNVIKSNVYKFKAIED